MYRFLLKIFFLLLLTHLTRSLSAQNNIEFDEKRDWEIFPIVNYDSDVGFGYGIKGFFYNFLGNKESFDLTIYNSTKGERWYQFVYSIPDKQRRQGKKYNLAFDLILDYDKWINYPYFNNSYFPSEYYIYGSDESSENYIREPIEIKAMLSRAFTRDFIVDFGLKFSSISCYNFDADGYLQYLDPDQAQHLSVIFNFGLDTRTDFINPQKGIVVTISNELARDVTGKHESFYRIGLKFNSYLKISVPEIILASRIILQAQTETSYQNRLVLGGNKSIRGIPQDRYLSYSSILLNSELRFPIWWRIGAVVGLDVGNSPSTPKWILNPVAGLRFYMDNFVVRADVGFGEESTGVYFNFGHLF